MRMPLSGRAARMAVSIFERGAPWGRLSSRPRWSAGPSCNGLVGARGRATEAQLMFFSGTGYVATAVEYANEMDVALFTYDLPGTVTPVNWLASVR